MLDILVPTVLTAVLCFLLYSFVANEFLPTWLNPVKTVSNTFTANVINQKKSTEKEETAREFCERRGREIFAKELVCMLICLFVAPLSLANLISDEQQSRFFFAGIQMKTDEFPNSGKLLYQQIPLVEKLVPLLLGFFIFEAAVVEKWVVPGFKRNLDMMVHHVLALIFFPLCLSYHTGEFFLLIWLSYEMSTPFLSLAAIMEVKYSKEHPLYQVAGLLFAFFFVTIRLGTAPAVLFLLSRCTDNFTDPLVFVLSVLSFIPVCLNLFWGTKIFKKISEKAQGGNKKKSKKN